MGRNGEYFVRLRRLKGHNVGFVKNMSIGALVTVRRILLTIERIMLKTRLTSTQSEDTGRWEFGDAELRRQRSDERCQ
jgi:hypothetical protein